MGVDRLVPREAILAALAFGGGQAEESSMVATDHAAESLLQSRRAASKV